MDKEQEQKLLEALNEFHSDEDWDSIEQFIEDLNASFDDMIYNCLKKGREIYGDNNDEK